MKQQCQNQILVWTAANPIMIKPPPNLLPITRTASDFTWPVRTRINKWFSMKMIQDGSRRWRWSNYQQKTTGSVLDEVTKWRYSSKFHRKQNILWHNVLEVSNVVLKVDFWLRGIPASKIHNKSLTNKNQGLHTHLALQKKEAIFIHWFLYFFFFCLRQKVHRHRKSIFRCYRCKLGFLGIHSDATKTLFLHMIRTSQVLSTENR